MAETSLAAEVLGGMITPAVLISAGGTLVLSTSNRLSRVVDRVRVLATDAERLERHPENVEAENKRLLIASQLRSLSERAIILRSAIAVLYAAIGFLVATSIGVGILTLLRWEYSWLPVTLGLLGAGALLWASVLLVREGRLAISSTLEEMKYVRILLSKSEAATQDVT